MTASLRRAAGTASLRPVARRFAAHSTASAPPSPRPCSAQPSFAPFAPSTPSRPSISLHSAHSDHPLPPFLPNQRLRPKRRFPAKTTVSGQNDRSPGSAAPKRRDSLIIIQNTTSCSHIAINKVSILNKTLKFGVPWDLNQASFVSGKTVSFHKVVF